MILSNKTKAYINLITCILWVVCIISFNFSNSTLTKNETTILMIALLLHSYTDYLIYKSKIKDK